MNTLEKWLAQMDKDGKIGWNYEEWEKLDFNDRLAVAVGKFAGQIYNGGISQFIYNEYGFYLNFLEGPVANELKMPELSEFIGKIRKIYQDCETSLEDGSVIDAEDYDDQEYYANLLEVKLDELDNEFYNGLGERLENKTCEYLDNIKEG